MVLSELQDIQGELQVFLDTAQSADIYQPLAALEKSAIDVGKAWSGSWIGYHARVYYRGIKPSPPGDHFSSEWGFMNPFFEERSKTWEEFDFEAVKKEVFRRAGNPDLGRALDVAQKGEVLFEEKRGQMISIFQTSIASRMDPFLERLLEETTKEKILTASDWVGYWRPSGSLMTRDNLALSQGLQLPPHISVLSEIMALRSPATVCATLSKVAKQAAAHLERVERQQRRTERVGTNVFIGHGRSRLWRDLKDFIEDRLRLPWDEFNRVPVAGITNIARLSEMLDAAAIALLVMTAEDEQADGKMHARMNVAHEAGLFQGRLGFTKAIVLLEEGCEEFSNIHGLGQIRFPRGEIRAAFEEVRQVLEREGLIEPP